MGVKLLKLTAKYDREKDPRAVVSYCLARMQDELAENIEQCQVSFADPDWIALLSEKLHDRWIDACVEFDRNPDSPSVPLPHRVIFATLKSKPCTVIEALVFPFAAHLIHDLPYALIDARFLEGERLPDYNLVNQQLAGELKTLERETHTRYDGTVPVLELAEQLGGHAATFTTDLGFRLVRAWAWYLAIRMGDSAQKRVVAHEIEQEPIRIMRAIRHPRVLEPAGQAYRALRFVFARLPRGWPRDAADQRLIRQAVRGPTTATAPVSPAPRVARRGLHLARTVSVNGSAPQRGTGALPDFVDNWEYRVDRFHAAGVATFGFLVEGDVDKLRDYCKRFFDHPSIGTLQVEPLSRHVMVQFAHTQQMCGPDDTFPDIGSQNEVSLIFFARLDRGGTSEVVAVAPYIVVDNPFSAMQAREVFGLPKEVGKFTDGIPAPADGDPPRLGASVRGVMNPGAPGAAFQWCNLVEVTRLPPPAPAGFDEVVDAVASAVQHPEADFQAVAGKFNTLLGEAELAGQLFPAMLSGKIRILSLKEFKDVSGSQFACYQSFIATEMDVQHLHAMRALGSKYELTFANLGTHPVATQLGLQGKLASRLSFTMQYDLDLTGTEL
jgi:hypothetical protein